MRLGKQRGTEGQRQRGKEKERKEETERKEGREEGREEEKERKEERFRDKAKKRYVRQRVCVCVRARIDLPPNPQFCSTHKHLSEG